MVVFGIVLRGNSYNKSTISIHLICVFMTVKAITILINKRVPLCKVKNQVFKNAPRLILVFVVLRGQMNLLRFDSFRDSLDQYKIVETSAIYCGKIKSPFKKLVRHCEIRTSQLY